MTASMKASVYSMLLVAAFLAAPGWSNAVAGTLVATRVIPAGAVIGVSDVAVSDHDVSGGVATPEAAIGKEARVMIHTGSVILSAHLQPPALVERNELVEMRYVRGPLFIRSEGRALDRGALGERVRVMNLSSRAIVSAIVAEVGVVSVSQ